MLLLKKSLAVIIFVLITFSVNAQETDTTGHVYHFDGNVTVTNNGFSFIPLFSLGKPAALVTLSAGGDRFSFDPQFRFDLDGLRPWTFIFIWRYKIIEKEKFQLKVGTHLPAYSFREYTSQVDGETQVRLVPYRMVAGELLPSYTISSHLSLGAYYIHGMALETFDPTKHIDFLSLRAFITRIRLSKQFYFNWNPEVYYLNMYGVDGFYAAQSISLGHQKLPVSLSTSMNIKIQSEIESKDFDWNISLVYTFSNNFTKK